MSRLSLEAAVEHWRFAEPIIVSRGAYYGHDVVVVTLRDKDGNVGRGECCALSHYGDSAQKVIKTLHDLRSEIDGLTRQSLLDRLPPGAARNGLDCAMWDLEARREGVSVWQLAGIERPATIRTNRTIMLGTPEQMVAFASAYTSYNSLKLKLGSNNPGKAARAVRDARPDIDLMLDANEGFTTAVLEASLDDFLAADIKLVEQPLPAGNDSDLEGLNYPLPLAADESFLHYGQLADVARKYDFINIKLDKCGGLTAALEIHQRATEMGLGIMVGCMFGTSLAMAAAMPVAALASCVDLDGPFYLEKDRDGAPTVKDGAWQLSAPSLWGDQTPP